MAMPYFMSSFKSHAMQIDKNGGLSFALYQRVPQHFLSFSCLISRQAEEPISAHFGKSKCMFFFSTELMHGIVYRYHHTWNTELSEPPMPPPLPSKYSLSVDHRLTASMCRSDRNWNTRLMFRFSLTEVRNNFSPVFRANFSTS